MMDRSRTSENRVTPQYIAVEGPIGVGKTTLARKLAATFNYEALLENESQNPFLERFYRERSRYALATQMHFLIQRVRQLEALRQSDLFTSRCVSDFLIEKDQLFAQANLGSEEYALYSQVHERLIGNVRRPDLVIYLQAPVDVLLARIRARGVDCEQTIEHRYLEQINTAYSELFHYYDAAPLLIVNATAIDFANDDNHYTELVTYLQTVRSGRHYFNPTFLR